MNTIFTQFRHTWIRITKFKLLTFSTSKFKMWSIFKALMSYFSTVIQNHRVFMRLRASENISCQLALEMLWANRQWILPVFATGTEIFDIIGGLGHLNSFAFTLNLEHPFSFNSWKHSYPILQSLYFILGTHFPDFATRHWDFKGGTRRKRGNWTNREYR